MVKHLQNVIANILGNNIHNPLYENNFGPTEPLSRTQLYDLDLDIVFNWLKGNFDDYELYTKENTHLQIFWNLFVKDQLGVNEEEILYFRDSLGRCRTVIPKSERQAVLLHLHSSSKNGKHLQDYEMIAWARRVCYWPYMERDITEFCKSCLVCQCCDIIF